MLHIKPFQPERGFFFFGGGGDWGGGGKYSQDTHIYSSN